MKKVVPLVPLQNIRQMENQLNTINCEIRYKKLQKRNMESVRYFMNSKWVDAGAIHCDGPKS